MTTASVDEAGEVRCGACGKLLGTASDGRIDLGPASVECGEELTCRRCKTANQTE